MRRAILIPSLLLALGSIHAPRHTEASPVAILMPPLVTTVATEPPRSELLRLADMATKLGPMPRALVEPLVRWRCSLRDEAHASIRSSALPAEPSYVIPDLTVLTTEPVVDRQSSGFGWRSDPIHGERKFHKGSDVRGDRGTPILAAGDGVVIRAQNQDGYGNVVYIDHGGGVITRYAHQKKIEIAKGTVVTAGQEIGHIGSTGRATGPHLHFEVRLDGQPVNPVTALAIAALQREAPLAGRFAALSLAPEIQSKVKSEIDHSREQKESRPERRGRALITRMGVRPSS